MARTNEWRSPWTRRLAGLVAVAAGSLVLIAAPAAAESKAREGTPAAKAEVKGEKVNINTATTEELETLPGVGPSLALRILEYRKTNGPFKRAEDLMNVKGIGEKSFQKLKDRITVGS
jgi:competence protein ComEA